MQVAPAETFRHQRQDVGIGDQVAAPQAVLDQAAELGALGHGVAQHVAGGDVDDPVGLLQPAGLGALAGAGGPEEDQLHAVCPGVA